MAPPKKYKPLHPKARTSNRAFFIPPLLRQHSSPAPIGNQREE
jgi:hypothetical protein